MPRHTKKYHQRLISALYTLGILILVSAVVLIVLYFKDQGRKTVDVNAINDNLQITSPAFSDNQAIPPQYTCQGENVSPPLNISNVPPDAKSLALVLHDPDAVGSDFTHWLMWNIPIATHTIAVNTVPIGAEQGVNGAGEAKYTGPCPPTGTGTHHYLFEVYALDKNLSLEGTTDRLKLMNAIKNHILTQHTLTGLVSAKS